MFYNCLPSEYDHKKNVLLVYIKKKKKKKKENCYNNLVKMELEWLMISNLQ